MKRHHNNKFAIIIGILYPLYALPWIFKGMVKNEKWAFVIFSFLMGLFAILYPPVGDFHQYTMKAATYSFLSWDQFLAIITLKLDFLLYITGYLLDKINVPFDFTRFLYNFFGYILISILYRDIRANNPILNEKRFALKSLVVFVGLSLVGNLFRFGFSSQLFMYGAYLVTFRENKKGWIFVALSVFNHFSYIIFAVFLFIFKVFRIHFSRNFIIFIGVTAVLLSGDLFIDLFNMLPLPTNIIEHYSYYLDGYYAKDWQNALTWKEQLARMIESCIKYIMVFMYILLYTKADKKQTILTNMLMILSFVTLPFTVINGRFMGVMSYSIKIFYFKNFKSTKIFKKTLNLLFVFSLLSILMGIWECRRQLSISREFQLVYMPSFLILTNTYDMKWIISNIDDEGGFLRIMN